MNLIISTSEFTEMGTCFARLRKECKEKFLLENGKKIYQNTSIVTDYVCDEAAKGTCISTFIP